MKMCPICSTKLSRTLLESNLPALQCPNCHGMWISSNEYLTWVTTQSPPTFGGMDASQNFETPYPTSDNNKALLCPDCGRILRRFKIWPNHDFHLDRCQSCNGIWFDENEWQTLQSQNFHLQLNDFFTHAWQEKLRGQEMHLRFDKMYRDVFGSDDYDKVKEMRNWLIAHPNGNRLLAYLTDRDPYSG